MTESTIGTRLREALACADMKITAFQEAVEARGPSGSSYPMVHRYLADKREPSLEFLRAAADVLGVRYWWLAVGQGERTEELQRERQELSEMAAVASGSGKKPSPEDPRRRQWQRAVTFKWDVLTAMGFPDPQAERNVDPDHPAAELMTYFRNVNAGRISPWVPALSDVARRMRSDPETLGRALLGPLEVLGLDPTAMGDKDTPGTSNETVNDYIVAMIPVLTDLVPEVKRVTTNQEEEHAEEA